MTDPRIPVSSQRHITNFSFTPAFAEICADDPVGLPTRATISFEVMPPRQPTNAPKFWRTVQELVEARPDFISVTFGAAGQDKKSAREVSSLLARHSPVQPIAHLTCVGTSPKEVRQLTADYLDTGIRTFLALRGDTPINRPGWHAAPDSMNSAADLIRAIREVEFIRCATTPGNALRASLQPLRIGVATFPCGNPAAHTSVEEEVERLVFKQVAGADFAITQLAWSVDDFIRFFDRALAEGVTIPIIPGVLPPADVRRVRRVQELTGVEPPVWLLDRLESCEDPLEAAKQGAHVGARLAAELIEAGAPGIHFFTFNRSDIALAALNEAAELIEHPELIGDLRAEHLSPALSTS